MQLALLEKGVQFSEVLAPEEDTEPLPELVLGDTLVSGAQACLLALEEAVSQVTVLDVAFTITTITTTTTTITTTTTTTTIAANS